jgi:hypothetical protein
MSDTGSPRTRSLSHMRVPILPNCNHPYVYLCPISLTQLCILLSSLSILTDLEIAQVKLNPTLFPNVPSSVLVHEGFSNEHAKTASLILAEVKSLLASTGATSVTCVRIPASLLIPPLKCFLFPLFRWATP